MHADATTFFNFFSTFMAILTLILLLKLEYKAIKEITFNQKNFE
jgi:hypothetical protein